MISEVSTSVLTSQTEVYIYGCPTLFTVSSEDFSTSSHFSTEFLGGHPRLVSPIQYPTIHNILLQSPLLFPSYGIE